MIDYITRLPKDSTVAININNCHSNISVFKLRGLKKEPLRNSILKYSQIREYWFQKALSDNEAEGRWSSLFPLLKQYCQKIKVINKKLWIAKQCSQEMLLGFHENCRKTWDFFLVYARHKQLLLITDYALQPDYSILVSLLQRQNNSFVNIWALFTKDELLEKRLYKRSSESNGDMLALDNSVLRDATKTTQAIKIEHIQSEALRAYYVHRHRQLNNIRDSTCKRN
ncbi:hypothetical protein BY458DRAFT_494779 [Sporodiniella umbellata]|nr:hypothetical protein BY458DRAFT_494779 [Sporodiniella umbellata]